VELPHAAVRVDRVDHRQRQASRTLAEETPIALAYNGTSTAVLMATPADLTEVATGFSLTEAIIRQPCEIEDLDIVRHQDGIELRMWLSPERGHHLSARRRRLVGPTGCGLCGIESLADATPPVPSVTRGFSLTPDQISDAVQLLSDAQELNHATRATHRRVLSA
jgi:FdhD protein